MLALDTDYAVTGIGAEGGFTSGTVTLDTAVTSTTVRIERILPIERTTDFPNSGPFDIPALNTQFDKVIAIEQQLDADIGSARADIADALEMFKTIGAIGQGLDWKARRRTSGLP